MNLSLGFRLKMISYNRNMTCPPSRAGIGSTFNTASMMDKNAVRCQKACQSQLDGKIDPMAIKPPTDSYAFSCENNNLIDLM